MPLSSPGIGSGLDIKSIVESSVAAQITPLQQKQDKKVQDVQTEISAIGQLKNNLAGLKASLGNLSDLNKLYSTQFNLSDPGYITPTLSAKAAKGSYQIEVDKLAQKQSLATGYFSSSNTSIGNGSITINFGTYNSNKTTFTNNATASPVTINIPSGSDSLTSIRDAINNSKSGVNATIVQDAQGYRMTITSSQTGEDYAMQITGTINALGYDPTLGSSSLNETTAAQNSNVKINGLLLNQSTNSLSTAIAGVTLDLNKAEVGKIITMSITDNQDQLTGLINDFVSKYNDTMAYLTNLTGYNANTKQGGAFQGDPQFRGLKLSLNQWATTPQNNSNINIKSLADLGIVTNRQGMLQVDQTKLSNAMDNNYAEIGTLFAKTATATDGNIRINAINSTVPAGVYAVNLTEFTPGVSMSGEIGQLAATSSDGFTLSGSKLMAGLSINVLSGTTGDRGKIVVHDGLAVSMNQLLDSYTDSNKGDLKKRSDQLQKQISQLGLEQTGINRRSDTLSKRYYAQWNALDLLISKSKSTTDFLTKQLDQFSSKTK